MGKKILFDFNYSRAQWVNLCEPLFAGNEIHWISFIDKSADEFQHINNHHYHYWNEYNSSQEIISSIEPDLVISMDNLAPLSISLIYQCKKQNISSYYLQHGIFSKYQDYQLLDAASKKNSSAITTVDKKGFSTLSFLRSSIPYLFFRPKLISYITLSKWKGLRTAAFLIKCNERIPDYYLCYSQENAIIHQQLDNIGTEKIIVVGNPEFDKFSKEYDQVLVRGDSDPYWLLIDQAISGSDLGESFISREDHLAIYEDIALAARKNGCQLKVKLHPGDYNREDIGRISNCEFITDSKNIVALVKGSNVCIGFWSAMLSVIVHFKPIILIKIFDLSFYQKMQKYSNVMVLNSSKDIQNIKEFRIEPMDADLIEPTNYIWNLNKIINNN